MACARPAPCCRPHDRPGDPRTRRGGPDMTVPAAHAVVVVWGTFPQRVATSGDVTYVAGEHLHDWLLGQPSCLSRTQLAALGSANTPSLFAELPRSVQGSCKVVRRAV